jgi:hypothetical protein
LGGQWSLSINPGKSSEYLFFSSLFLQEIFSFAIMKSEDLQKLVTLKQQNGDNPTKVFHDLNGLVSLRTIKRWYKMINETGSINLSC